MTLSQRQQLVTLGFMVLVLFVLRELRLLMEAKERATPINSGSTNLSLPPFVVESSDMHQKPQVATPHASERPKSKSEVTNIQVVSENTLESAPQESELPNITSYETKLKEALEEVKSLQASRLFEGKAQKSLTRDPTNLVRRVSHAEIKEVHRSTSKHEYSRSMLSGQLASVPGDPSRSRVSRAPTLPFAGVFMCNDVAESYGAAWMIHKKKFMNTPFGPPWTEKFDLSDSMLVFRENLALPPRLHFLTFAHFCYCNN